MKTKLLSLYKKWNEKYPNFSTNRIMIDLDEYPNIIYFGIKPVGIVKNPSNYQVACITPKEKSYYGVNQTIIKGAVFREYYKYLGQPIIFGTEVVFSLGMHSGDDLFRLLATSLEHNIEKTRLLKILEEISTYKHNYKRNLFVQYIMANPLFENFQKLLGMPYFYYKFWKSSKSYVNVSYIKNIYKIGVPVKELEVQRCWMYLNEQMLTLPYKILFKIINSPIYNNRCHLYNDYLGMLIRLLQNNVVNKHDWPYIISTEDKLVQLHTKILRVYNQHLQLVKTKEFQEKYQHYYPQAQKFEYKNDDYSIIACKDANELCTEGQYLHHCVASYADSVAEGKEYILFLRKNNAIDIPYFTIDVLPNKTVRQIHGLNNCNIVPEIKEFIHKWASHHKLDITNTCGVYGHL